MEMTQTVANFYFEYDPETGYLTNRIDRGARAFAGARAGTKQTGGYRVVGITLGGNNKKFLEHRLIWFMMTGEWPNTIDHINGKKADNRWCNMRNGTQGENLANSKKHVDNKSGYKGVSIFNGKYPVAQITYGGKRYYLGSYKTAEEAHEMYCRVAKVLHGDFFNNGMEVA